MRIIAGKLKGRKIDTQGKGLRPTTSVVKSALFNILGDDIINKIFIDVFAGTGSVGFEAYSRGAKEVIFIENERNAIKLLEENIKKLNVNGRVIGINAFTFLKNYEIENDFIFFSPPYDTIHWPSLTREIEKSRLIKNSLIIIQHPKYVEIESFLLNKIDVRRYGLNKLTFLRSKE
ncbi:MAG TPA: 16S rRNA (guanine(966)-N(2))-methyltransferase RsmD [Spirochaetota bacterium]|nr:16S rRNA (guanine(966)-N(2))-methyltransferase RsmD [Spirochaetota bacterium]HOM37823.1 16S rRNA (guanine(966)-N(2))-methyltransferase RsmD [Spirochaetota bacterium]HPQ49300.1 16S rRNA (guanine(966)-N(2))-methyltransferase RsmD [Spirochaetota bacterium]